MWMFTTALFLVFCNYIQPRNPSVGTGYKKTVCKEIHGLMQRANSLENTLKLGKIDGKRRRGYQRMRWLDGTLWT